MYFISMIFLIYLVLLLSIYSSRPSKHWLYNHCMILHCLILQHGYYATVWVRIIIFDCFVSSNQVIHCEIFICKLSASATYRNGIADFQSSRILLCGCHFQYLWSTCQLKSRPFHQFLSLRVLLAEVFVAFL